MTNAQLVDTLESLRSEKAVVSAEAEVLQQELGEKQHHLSRLNAAISALKSLLPDGQTEIPRSAEGDSRCVGEGDHGVGRCSRIRGSSVRSAGAASEVPAGRWPATAIEADGLRSAAEDRSAGYFGLLRRSFFEYFGRENIEQFWLRPDSALNTAIDRARDEDLILQIEDPQGGPALSHHQLSGIRHWSPGSLPR